MEGTSGGWHLLFGEWADVTEGVRPLDTYRCPQCGRLEFYDHDFTPAGSLTGGGYPPTKRNGGPWFAPLKIPGKTAVS